MTHRTTRTGTLALLFATLVCGTSAHADTKDPRFFFYGYTAPEAAQLTGLTPTDAYYLFWGKNDESLAGFLPGWDITLERNGQVIDGPFRFGEVRSVAEIQARYAAPTETQRLLETLDALNGLFEDYDPVVTQATFAQRLRATLTATAPCPSTNILPAALCAQRQKSFSEGRARVDANVAFAVHEGYRDVAPTASTTYVLRATKDTETKVLGTLIVDPATAASRIAAPVGLEDVSSQQQRCDVPGLKQSGVLALAWDSPFVPPKPAPGSPDPIPTEAPLLSHNLAGYLVLASTGPCEGTPPAVDLATLARTASLDTAGRPVIPGFVSLADTLIQAGRRPAIDPASGRRLAPADFNDALPPAGSVGWNPPGFPTDAQASTWRATYASLVASAEVVTARGLKPAQRVCVYVAPVDRAGQIGSTAAVATRVADFEKPPAPWDVQVEAETSSTWNGNGYVIEDTFALVWEPVEVQTTLARDGSVACNPNEASSTQRLVLASEATDCGKPDKETRINLDVEEYLVYRFTSPREVNGFFDTDGDGFADATERTSDLDPGTACTESATPSGPDAVSRLLARIPASQVEFEVGSNRRILRFQDPTPAASKDEVFWYAIASRGKNGWVGAPGAPVRGVFHDKRPAPRPALESITYGSCEPTVVPFDPFYNSVVVARDLTDDARAKDGTLRLYCLDLPRGPYDPIARMVSGYLGAARFTLDKYNTLRPYVRSDEENNSALLDTLALLWTSRLRAQDPCLVYAEVVDVNGRVVATSDPLTDLAIENRDGRIGLNLIDGCTAGPPSPIEPGAVIDAPIKIGLPVGTPAEVCGDISFESDGQLFKLGTICGSDQYTLKLPDLGGELQCYALTVTGPNKVLGMPLYLPCVKAKTTIPPGPPSLWKLDLPPDQATGTLSWKPPGSAIAGIIVQVEETTTGAFKTAFLTPSALGPNDTFAGEIALGGLLPAGTTQQWCVKARSLSAASTGDTGGMTSDWVGPLCGSRVPAGTSLPSYLPWPAMPAPGVGATLTASYLPREGVPVVKVGTFDPKEIWPDSTDPDAEVGVCGPETLPDCYLNPPDNVPTDSCIAPHRNAHARCIDICGVLNKAAGGLTNFMGYRQVWDAALATWGPFIQVTPVLGGPFCFFGNEFASGRQKFGLMDPSFIAARFATEPNAPATYELAFVDGYPHEPGTKIRYAFVRFGPEGQIVETQFSTELQIPAEDAP